MPRPDEHYRVLGLPPGASRDEIQRAYRDLVQVWHPDRFGANDRLREKAERNLQRINKAYAALSDEPPQDVPKKRESRLSSTYQAVLDLGDMVRTSIGGFKMPEMAKRKPRVVFVDRHSGQARAPQRRPLGPALIVIGVVVVVAAGLFVLLT